MLGVSFSLSLGGLALGNSRDGSIEIISGGVKYESLLIYKEAERERNQRENVSRRQEFSDASVKYIQALLKDMQRHNQLSLSFLSEVPNIWNVNAGQFPTLGKVKLMIEPFLRQSLEESNNAYDPFLQSYIAISRIGFNTGVNKVIEDFQAEKGRAFSYKYLKKKDLEMALSQSFTENGYEGPILLMSNKKNIRIMALQSQEKDAIPNMP
jgi:hypothetical protein